MSGPKDENRKPSDPDSFGVGMLEDGTLNVISPEDFAERVALRDAEDDDEGIEDDDDLSDLDDIEALADA